LLTPDTRKSHLIAKFHWSVVLF